MSRILRHLLAAVFIWAAIHSTAYAQNAATQSVADDAQKTRDALLAVINRPKVDLAATEDSQTKDGDLTRIHFTYSSEANQRVPGILLAKPETLADGKRHAVTIVMHGTGGSKTGEIATLRELAEHGFIAVAIDGRFHGERGKPADYNGAIAKAFEDRKSHPLYYDTVWDVMRLIDYLQTRSDVDPKKIGLMGISKGGIETWLTAAIDPRVAVAIPCISAQSFAWGLANDGWHHRVGTVQAGFDLAAKNEGVAKPDAAFVQLFYDRLIPGIYTIFDGPKMLPLIAPRPLLVISGENDPINPLAGVKLCEEATQAAYDKAGASDRFQMIIEPKTGHAINKEAHAAAIAWFLKWLNQ
jgi:pimeloyl-ACP methyl ester carboxylesterase